MGLIGLPPDLVWLVPQTNAQLGVGPIKLHEQLGDGDIQVVEPRGGPYDPLGWRTGPPIVVGTRTGDILAGKVVSRRDVHLSKDVVGVVAIRDNTT